MVLPVLSYSLLGFGYDNSAPTWSPYSKKIAFVSDRDYNNEIYVMNADISGQKRLTETE
ncbi:MAG: PD40 domain-containing protein [Actinobacteria bacterium]|nr:PD40 domain-containing protein [Actinomycetota bacterium]